MTVTLRAAPLYDDSRQPRLLAWWRDSGRTAPIPPLSLHRGHLLLVASGLLAVRTETGSWAAGAGTALWIPPGQAHHLATHGAVSGWFADLLPEACPDLPRSMGTAPAGGLLREAVMRWAQRPGEAGVQSPPQDLAEGRLEALILDEIAALPLQPADLPMPVFAPVRAIADAMLRHPADNQPLASLADAAGLSRRTATRRFAAETGMSFSAWRQRLRLLRAMEMLVDGAGVTETALDLGYDSPSAFTAMFRRSFGAGPSEYAGRRKPRMRVSA